MKFRTVLTLVLLTVAFGALALGQQNSIQQDDRYSVLGYNPPELQRLGIQWPTAPPDLAACKAQEPYEPHYTNLLKYVPKDIKFRVQTEDECAWTLAGSQWLWKKRPAGTKVAVDSEGRDLFDLGDEVGQACGNPRPISYGFPKPTPLQPPSCVITGSAEAGLGADVKFVTGGKMYLDGNFLRDWRPGHEASPMLDQAGPGEHTFRLDVFGPGGEASCRTKFSVEAPQPPPDVVETHNCPTCKVDIQLHPQTKTVKLTVEAEGYLPGTWSIDGQVIGTGTTLLVSHDRLLKIAGKGEHEILFKAVDDKGHEVICKGSVTLKQGKNGRFWLFKLPGLNCLYTWTVDIKNWSLSGTLEKGACLAAGYGAYWWVSRGAAAALPQKIWVPGRP